jgi:hypothetical protein
VKEILDLGLMPPSNALLSSPEAPEQAYELQAVVCTKCHLMQTSFDVPPEVLFNDEYPYFSGQSQDWVEHCHRFSIHAQKRFNLTPESLVVEIGGNDGTQLKGFNCHTLNVEPSRSVAEASRQAGIETRECRWEEVRGLQADLIVGNNVLAHTPTLNEFINAVAENLKPSGVASFEFPWVLNLLQGGQFDTIYHEHYSYLSLTAVLPAFLRHGLHVFDVEQLSTHGGSLRIYVRHALNERESVGRFMARESPLMNDRTYQMFRRNACVCRDTFRRFVEDTPKLYGYGAAAKGNTLLNWAHITQIEAVGDTTPAKQGKYLPGSHIPVISEQALIERQPRTLWVIPWNWKREIVAKLRPRLPQTRFVTAIPTLEFL